MSLLYEGDALPSVTTSQILLRRHRPQSMIGTDGHFGPKTKTAVKAFQKSRSLIDDGIIGKNTWNKFASVSGFQTIDVVDGTDPSLIAYEANDLRAAGFDPIVVFGMSNGVEVVMNQINAKARSGKVMLLRFHGHGNKGIQNVTGGELNGSPHLASISITNFDQIQSALIRIKHIFVPFGSVQMLGCYVGGGQGPALMQKLATTWAVPVSAGAHLQLGGGRNTFRFEGSTVTGFPGGQTLKVWSQSMELVHGNTSMPD
jgi:Putative peptidoglycan binding domain